MAISAFRSRGGRNDSTDMQISQGGALKPIHEDSQPDGYQGKYWPPIINIKGRVREAMAHQESQKAVYESRVRYRRTPAGVVQVSPDGGEQIIDSPEDLMNRGETEDAGLLAHKIAYSSASEMPLVERRRLYGTINPDEAADNDPTAQTVAQNLGFGRELSPEEAAGTTDFDAQGNQVGFTLRGDDPSVRAVLDSYSQPEPESTDSYYDGLYDDDAQRVFEVMRSREREVRADNGDPFQDELFARLNSRYENLKAMEQSKTEQADLAEQEAQAAEAEKRENIRNMMRNQYELHVKQVQSAYDQFYNQYKDVIESIQSADPALVQKLASGEKLNEDEQADAQLAGINSTSAKIFGQFQQIAMAAQQAQTQLNAFDYQMNEARISEMVGAEPATDGVSDVMARQGVPAEMQRPSQTPLDPRGQEIVKRIQTKAAELEADNPVLNAPSEPIANSQLNTHDLERANLTLKALAQDVEAGEIAPSEALRFFRNKLIREVNPEDFTRVITATNAGRTLYESQKVDFTVPSFLDAEKAIDRDATAEKDTLYDRIDSHIRGNYHWRKSLRNKDIDMRRNIVATAILSEVQHDTIAKGGFGFRNGYNTFMKILRLWEDENGSHLFNEKVAAKIAKTLKAKEALIPPPGINARIDVRKREDAQRQLIHDRIIAQARKNKKRQKKNERMWR